MLCQLCTGCWQYHALWQIILRCLQVPELSSSWHGQPVLRRLPLQPVQILLPSGILCSLQPGLVTPAALASPAGTPRGLPNDPARGGNIWQRCEELEDAAREMQAQKDALLHERMQAVAVSIFMHTLGQGRCRSCSRKPTGHCRRARARWTPCCNSTCRSWRRTSFQTLGRARHLAGCKGL